MAEMQEARNRVANDFGAAVARKATDAFLLFHARRSAAFVEMAAAPSPRVATVLELEAKPPVSPLGSAKAETIRSARVATAELFTQLGEDKGDAELLAAMAIRRRLIDRARDASWHDAGGVLDELGKASGGPLGPLSEDVTLRTIQPQLVEFCWLSSSVRTAADARTVAAVADDRRVQRIDLPRRLQREIGGTVPLVGAPAYRARHGVAGRAVNVAIIDAEISRLHLSFGARVIHKANFTREPWGNPDGHGTAVAGIIGAVSATLSGVAPEVTFYNYKVLATVDALNGDDFGGALAIQQALEDGAQIANCSWGAGPAGDGQSREARACNTAWGLGLVIVKSAGNLGPGPSTLTTPADADGVVVVGATNRTGTAVPSYSSRGPTAHGQTRPHLVAPGGTPEDEITSCLPSGGFGLCGFGTSFAAPHVSGMIALLLSQEPGKTPDDIRRDLLATCRRLTGVDANGQGEGLVILP